MAGDVRPKSPAGFRFFKGFQPNLVGFGWGVGRAHAYCVYVCMHVCATVWLKLTNLGVLECLQGQMGVGARLVIGQKKNAQKKTAFRFLEPSARPECFGRVPGHFGLHPPPLGARAGCLRGPAPARLLREWGGGGSEHPSSCTKKSAKSVQSVRKKLRGWGKAQKWHVAHFFCKRVGQNTHQKTSSAALSTEEKDLVPGSPPQV